MQLQLLGGSTREDGRGQVTGSRSARLRGCPGGFASVRNARAPRVAVRLRPVQDLGNKRADQRGCGARGAPISQLGPAAAPLAGSFEARAIACGRSADTFGRHLCQCHRSRGCSRAVRCSNLVHRVVQVSPGAVQLAGAAWCPVCLCVRQAAKPACLMRRGCRHAPGPWRDCARAQTVCLQLHGVCAGASHSLMCMLPTHACMCSMRSLRLWGGAGLWRWPVAPCCAPLRPLPRCAGSTEHVTAARTGAAHAIMLHCSVSFTCRRLRRVPRLLAAGPGRRSGATAWALQSPAAPQQHPPTQHASHIARKNRFLRNACGAACACIGSGTLSRSSGQLEAGCVGRRPGSPRRGLAA